MTKRVLLVVVLLCLPRWAGATVYYVSKSGSDANSCGTATSTTQSNQKLTFAAGLACLAASDTLSIHTGTYVENITALSSANGSATGASGSSWPNATTITAYPGETVWVTPSGGQIAVYFPTGGTAISYQIWNAINVDGINLGAPGDSSVYIGHDANRIRWENSECKNAYWSCFGTFTGPYIELKNNVIHDGDRRCAGDAGHGIYVSGYSGNPTGTDQHNLIEGNTIYNFNCQSTDSGVQIYAFVTEGDCCGGWVIRKNWLHENGVGTFLASASAVPIQFYDNLVEDNVGSGIVLYTRLAGTLVYNNTVYSNGDRGIEVGTGGAATAILIKNNAITSNSGAPITYWNSDPTTYGTSQFNDYNANGGSNLVDDQNSLSTNSSNITTAPGYTNAGANDFTISAGGNLVDAGTTLATVTDDYLGVSRPQGASYDIGAYELVSAGGTPSRKSIMTLGVGDEQ